MNFEAKGVGRLEKARKNRKLHNGYVRHESCATARSQRSEASAQDNRQHTSSVGHRRRRSFMPTRLNSKVICDTKRDESTSIDDADGNSSFLPHIEQCVSSPASPFTDTSPPPTPHPLNFSNRMSPICSYSAAGFSGLINQLRVTESEKDMICSLLDPNDSITYLGESDNSIGIVEAASARGASLEEYEYSLHSFVGMSGQETEGEGKRFSRPDLMVVDEGKRQVTEIVSAHPFILIPASPVSAIDDYFEFERAEEDENDSGLPVG